MTLAGLVDDRRLFKLREVACVLSLKIDRVWSTDRDSEEEICKDNGLDSAFFFYA